MKSRFLIITGMSGAGKTQAMRTLEDLRYFCVDNLPATFITQFAKMSSQVYKNNVAVVVDIRGGKYFEKILQVLEELDNAKQEYELLYLEATDETLVRRYKETRRRHPLGGKHALLKNIRTERELLSQVREKATCIIDTSEISTSELKNKIIDMYGDLEPKERMGIVIRSFGFKYGIPLDSDLVLDVRFLPNPFYVEGLRQLNGSDKPVADYISSFPQTAEYLEMQEKLIDFLVPQYIKEGKSQLVISVGCTGGQHRSVFVALKLYEHLSAQDYQVEITHREAKIK